MPHIEVLPPTKAQASTPGWAYVPDTGYDPSKASLAPSSTSRKRTTRVQKSGGGIGGSELTARQQNAILKHLVELDRDNHRDTHIPVPVKARDGAGRVSRGKLTPAVRRILTSQKTFANHLADEAAVAPASQQPQNPAPKDAVPSSKSKTPKTKSTSPPASASPLSSESTVDPLLKSYIPPIPPPSLLEELTTAPPLPYAAARAGPSTLPSPSRRHFCEICGYWGRVRCMKCGARVCGLECKGVHEEGRCLRFYA
ncbi:MAG: hypothetical protein M1833_006822 [Piccolia ochrophora]|nr:MAG: hypothetical protein M1833_006822 [Piccolia ochrophora]